MKIEHLSLSAIFEYGNNSRTHSDEQVEQIVKSINEFGFTNPILINKDGRIIAGHGRYRAAMKMNLVKVPCIRLTNLSERQERAYVIADNKIALNAGFDFEKLSEEIDALVSIDFDVDLLGFNEQELDALLKSDFNLFPKPDTVEVSGYTRKKNGDEHPNQDQTPKPDTITNSGDLYGLGRHRLFCGDSRVEKDVQVLSGNSENIELVLNMAKGANPPWYGLGAAIIAAEQTGRTCYAMEIAPNFCDIVLERWEAFSGESAVLLGNYAEIEG